MKRLLIFSACFFGLLLLIGCITQVDRPAGIPDVLETPNPVLPATPEPPTPTPTTLPTATPVPPLPSPTPAPPLFLEIESPSYGVTVNSGLLSVVGRTLPEVAVKVNSTLFRADEEGRIVANVTLSPGQNIIAIVVTGADGSQLRDFITVVYNPPPTPSPTPFFLVIDQPGNVTIVGEQPVLVSGRTSPEARVTVNGVGVPVDEDGRFSTRVALSTGSNAIEVVAQSSRGRTLRSTVSLIYDP